MSDDQEVLNLLPANSADAKARIEKMIENIKSGTSNFPETRQSQAPGSTSASDAVKFTLLLYNLLLTTHDFHEGCANFAL